MKYVRFTAETPYCGTTIDEYQFFDDNITDEELGEIASEIIYHNAESFEYLATGWGEDFESEEDRESYYQDCTGGWDIISEEEYCNHLYENDC